jgi:glycosyltransferase involved in cell wall biosynthesis
MGRHVVNGRLPEMHRMKIAMYVPSWPLGDFPNGIVTYAAFLVPALRSLGHDVFVITGVTNDDDPFTINLKRYGKTTGVFQRLIFRIFPDLARHRNMSAALSAAIEELVEKHSIDLFEMEESFGWSHAIAKVRKVPVVVRLHGPWFLNKRERAKSDAGRERKEMRGIVSASAISSPSSNVLQSVRKYYGLELSSSACIPNPIECARETDLWNLDNCDVNSILFVGRFDKIKGGDLILQVFEGLARSNPDLRLTFVGPDLGVTSPDGVMRSFEVHAQRTLTEAALARITFRGPLHHSELPSLRRRHLVTICMSRSEVFPYSVLESMAMGCPTAATDVGGISEMIETGRNGMLVPSQDVSAMIAAIQKLLDDHELAARLGKQAWRDCVNRFGCSVVAEQMIAFYRSVVESAAGHKNH